MRPFPTIPPNDGSFLIAAARNGDWARVNALLDQGRDIEEKDERNLSILHYAVGNEQLELVRRLIAMGARLNEADNPFGAPLHIAIQHNKTNNITNMLLEAGADLSTPSREGETPLTTAMVYGRLDALRLLLDRGVRPSADAVSNGLGHGIGVGASDSKLPLLELVLAYGFDPNEGRSREDGSTLLMAVLGHCEALPLTQLLVEHGADIHARDAEGCTPFMYAANLYSEETIRLLASRGVDVDARDNQGRTALMKMLFIHEDDWDLLTDRHRPIDFLEWEEDIEQGNIYYARRAQVLLECGVDVHAIAPCGWNALLLCLAFGNAPTARLLVEHGASLADIGRKTICRAQRFMTLHGYTRELRLLEELAGAKWQPLLPEDD